VSIFAHAKRWAPVLDSDVLSAELVLGRVLKFAPTADADAFAAGGGLVAVLLEIPPVFLRCSTYSAFGTPVLRRGPSLVRLPRGGLGVLATAGI
jgi:hypothetical protein